MSVKLTISQKVALGGFRSRYLDAARALQEYVSILSQELGRKVEYDPDSDVVSEVVNKEIAGGKTAEADAGVPKAVDGLPATGTD